MKIFWGKRSGRYELSQDIFVLTVYVGDCSLVQCTLDSDSTSRDCLEYLRQKLNLKQLEVFGLKYQMRCNDPDNRMWKWLEPDKPLKKQLDKFACKPRQVQLGILFHTPNVFALHDPIARSFYYTLLKHDVVAGKYNFDVEMFIHLAALSLQVEHGDYEPTIHSLDFLRSIPLLPPQLSRSIQFVDDFLLRILTAYERHNGKESGVAAIEYIYEVIQNDGYGEELFNAKDDESTEIKLGYRPDSIIVKRYHRPTLYYKFEEIREILAQKRNLLIKCLDGSTSVFMLEDAEMAKYVGLVLAWQLKFAMNEAVVHKSVPHVLRNLQFGVPSTRTTNSIDLGTTGSICSQCPPSSSSVLTRATSNPFMNSSIHDSHSLQQAYSIRGSVSEANPINFNMTPLPPSISTPSIPHQLLSPGQPLPPPIILPFDARDVEHRILRQLLSEKKAARKIGSSPEIHTISSNSRYTSNHVVNKAPLGGVGKRLNGRFQVQETLSSSYSTPDLFLKYHSTPNLIQRNQFSQGKVVASSVSRPPGQQITYPVPQSSTVSRQISNASSRIQVNGAIRPPLENLQTILAGLKPPPESPISSPGRSIDENYSPVSTPSSGGLPDRSQLSFDKTSTGSEMNSRHVLVNGVVLNGRPDFLRPTDEKKLSKGQENVEFQTRTNDETIKMLTSKLSVPQILEVEYASIPQKRISAGASTSQLPENQGRNRHKAVLPYEDTRVMLHPTKKNNDGYINASNVQVPIADRLFRYILTQNPLKATVEDFYQMIWESGSRIVVAMSEARVSEASDSPMYWPTKAHEKLSIGGFSVRQRSVTVAKGMTTTIISLKYSSSGEKRIIYHLNFTGFKKDIDGVPASIETFLGFIDAVNSVKRHIENERMRDADSGVFVSSSMANSRRNSRSRSKSITRSTLMDVTNRIRSQSVEHGSRWKKKLTLTSSSAQQSTSSNQSEASAISASSNSSNGSAIFRAEPADQQGPIIVHCLDGSAVSGLFVLVELVVHCIENNINVEIAKLLRLLRQQRANLIKNVNQYKFAYESVLTYLQRSRLI